MQLTKQNIVSVQLLFEESVLSNNFKQIEQQFNLMKTQINTLKQNSLMIIEKINDIDPFDNIQFIQNKDQTEKGKNNNQDIKEKIGGDLSKIQIQKGECVDSSEAMIQAKQNIDKLYKNQEKTKMSKRNKQQVLQSQVSIRPDSRPTRQNVQSRSSQAMIKQFIKDLELRINALQSQKNSHDQQLETLQKQNEIFKKMLGYKDSKPKQKKNNQGNLDHKVQKRQSKLIQPQKIKEEQKKQQAPLAQNQQKEDELENNFITQFNKQIEAIRSNINLKFRGIDLKLQKCIDDIFETHLHIKQIKDQNIGNSKKIMILQQQTQALQSNNTCSTFPTFHQGQKTCLHRTKASLKSETAPQSAVNRTKASMDATNLNDTVESYKNYYEDKIVEIFQEMDRIRSQYYQVIEKLNSQGDASTDIDKLKNIAQKICHINNPIEQKLRKQISQVKRDLKKFKQQFNDLMFDINTGNGQTKTLVIKANQNKQDWKDVTQKIHKLRQQVLSYVKDLQAKINANNDLTIVIQELEVGISECKILNGKKVSISDFQKFAKRIQTRLNNFIRQVCQKQGMSYEHQALLVKQPWFCLSCDSQMKNYTGKVGKSVYAQKMPGKKVNPESHMVRRGESKFPPVN